MSNELKWGIVLGVIVIVAAMAYFFQSGREDEPLGLEPPAPVAEPVAKSPESQTPGTTVVTPSAPSPAVVPVAPAPVVTVESRPTVPVVDIPAPRPAPEPVSPNPAVEPKPVVSGTPIIITQEPRYYIVKSGDTLSSISVLYYGEGRFWKLIHEANKNIITNPDKLVDGWKLRIPYPSEVAEKKP